MREALGSKEFLSGALFVIIGFAIIVTGTDYRMGTLNRMGPGFIPVFLGYAMLFLGGSTAAIAIIKGSKDVITRVPLRVVVFISASVLSFALLIETAGLAIAVIVASILGNLAISPDKFWKIGMSTVLILALSIGLFVYGLERPWSSVVPL